MKYKYKIIIIQTVLLIMFGCAGKEEPENTVTRFTLKSGNTLIASLSNTGLNTADSLELINNLKNIFNPRKCIPGDSYEIEIGTYNNWTSFRYYPSGLTYYSVTKNPAGRIVFKKKKRLTKKITETLIGNIQTSLWEAMITRGARPELIIDFAEMFAWQIDFLTEPRVGDLYKLIWEKTILDDGTVIDTNILGAQYIASGKTHTAILFDFKDGNSDYYTTKGESLRRAFLRAPLQYRRISSFFARRRFHPILKIYRPHLGIDYAAPKGTPVSAIGDGKVTFAGWKGGYGRFVKIRHTNGYESYYGHLWKYGKNIKRGKNVKQGQIVGYVGSSGLSTGPHLDFRMRKHGKFINFLRIKPPSIKKVPKKYANAFKQTVKKTLTELAKIH